jgi:hypothetical protein
MASNRLRLHQADLAGRGWVRRDGTGKGYEHALEGVGAWEYVWVVFLFHKNVEEGGVGKARCSPPRSAIKGGVLDLAVVAKPVDRCRAETDRFTGRPSPMKPPLSVPVATHS